MLRDLVLFRPQQRYWLGIFVVCRLLPNSIASYKYDVIDRTNDILRKALKLPGDYEDVIGVPSHATAGGQAVGQPEHLLSVGVECYAGHRGEQTPRTLILGDRRIAVAEVLDAWLAPDYRYFKLKGADGDTYLVRHDERSNIWELTMFRAERVDGS